MRRVVDETELIKSVSSGISLVVFSADWCSPCKSLHKVLDDLHVEFPEINLMEVDVNASSDLAAKFSVTGLPTCISFFNGNENESHAVGFMGKDAVRRYLGSLRSNHPA